MKVSQLSRASGIPIPTIKFYVREGVLEPGIPTSRNQADYTNEHLRRLRLIRTLVEIGGLNLSRIRDVVAAVDDQTLNTHELLGLAHHALAPRVGGKLRTPDDPLTVAAVDRFLRDLGWRVSAANPARAVLAAALATLGQTGGGADISAFEPYAALADQLARQEVATLPPAASRAAAVEAAVIGTVVYEAVLLALRRLAQEHHSAVRFGGEDR